MKGCENERMWMKGCEMKGCEMKGFHRTETPVVQNTVISIDENNSYWTHHTQS